MFNKILSNLQFDPHYWRELRYFRNREAKTRTLRGVGVVFVILALGIQILAMVNAPSTGAAPSPNDLIPGGVQSKQELVDRCNTNYHYVALIYAWYGVSCADIAAPTSQVVYIRSTDYGANLYSIGRVPHFFPSEQPVTIWGATLYTRNLHDWDSGPYSTYQALKVTSDDGKTYFILFDCGNLTGIGVLNPYNPPVVVDPPPKVFCKYNNQLPADSPLCKPCEASQNPNDILNCLTYDKAAANITQNITDANNTTAKPGDTIQYTLTVKNGGKASAKKFIVKENIADVLIYSDVVNLNGGSLNRDTGDLTYPAMTITAGAQIEKIFTVKIKDPLPATVVGNNDPTAYDNKLTNVYGDTVNINVNQPVAVTATATLPNTGPGLGVVLMSIMAVMVGYFYFRSRLMVAEAILVEDVYVQEQTA